MRKLSLCVSSGVSRVGIAMAGATLALLVPTGPRAMAQSLSGAAVTPTKATTNSIFNHTVVWTYPSPSNRHPWYPNTYTFQGSGTDKGEVTFVDSTHVDVKIPRWWGVDNHWEIYSVSDGFTTIPFAGVDQGVRQGGSARIRLTLPTQLSSSAQLSVRARVGTFRAAEASIPVTPKEDGGDGRTFYTRAAPIVGVSGVFDENGTDYWELKDAQGNPMGTTGTVTNRYTGQIVLPKELPSRVKSVKIVYWVGPIRLDHIGGGFTDSDGNSVPMAAGWWNDPLNDPRDGAIFVVSGSRGLNMLNDPRSVPGLYAITAPGESQYWTTWYIKADPNGAPLTVTDTTSPLYGRWDTAVYPSPPPYVGVSAATVSSNTVTTFNYPSRIDRTTDIDASRSIIKVQPPGGGLLTSVRGVWLPTDADNDGTPDLSPPNYYTGGSFDSASNTIRLGTALPASSTIVLVDYAYTALARRYGGAGSEDPSEAPYGADWLIANPDYSFANRAKVYDPMNAEQMLRDLYWRVDPKDGKVRVDAAARRVLRITDDAAYIDAAPVDERLFTPFNPAAPDDGNSSINFSARVRYFNGQNMGPIGWLPTADGVPGASGVQIYVKYDGKSDYRVYGMAPENPKNNAYNQNQFSYPGDYGVGYLLRFEPNAGFSRVAIGGGGSARTATPPWTLPNNYISLPVGRHQYFFATSDDSIRNRDGSLWPNPLVKVRLPDRLQIPAPLIPDFYRYDWWTEQNPPSFMVGEPSFPGDDLRETYSYVNRTSYQPGQYSLNGKTYEFPADRHPVVHSLLSGIPFGQNADTTTMEGGGYFLGTIAPYKDGINPIYKPPSTGMSAGTTLTLSRMPTAFGTSSTRFTFKVIWQSFDPDTKIGRHPLYIKVFINNKSDAKPTDASGSLDPKAEYTGYTMVPVKPNPTAADYAAGLEYQYTTSLPAGPHTYYFEADDGFGPVRFPVRPDGRILEAPADDGDASTIEVPTWAQDRYVPGDEDFADNNDYCPGPYVNTAPVLSNASVTPSSGPYGTEFVYRVTYQDADGQRPFQTDILIEVSPGNVVRASLRQVDPRANNFVQGVEYQFRSSTLQGTVFAPGIHRYRFEFSDDWGNPEDINEKVRGELVYLPSAIQGVPGWYSGPTVSALKKPLLSSGSVSSSDGTSNPNTLWTYEVIYSHGNNVPPSFVTVYIGSQRDPLDPLATVTLERVTPTSTISVRVLSVPLNSVTGVFTNAQGTGKNYYTGGSFNASTGVITLGTALPEPGRDVWVTYSASPVYWDGGHPMVKRDAADNLYTDGAVYQYQTTLPGAERPGDLAIKYYYTFQSSDGTLVTQYDPASSPSAYALTRQSSGEGTVDTGEILNNGTSIGLTTYTSLHQPIVGPLPPTAVGSSGGLNEPNIWKNIETSPLRREYYAQLDSADSLAGVTVDPNGYQITVDPSVVHMVRGVWDNAGRTGTDYYNQGSGGKYNTASGVLALGTQLPNGVRRVFIDYYNRGDYRIDFVNGKIIFSQANLLTDVLEMEYWWAAAGPTAVGLNNPPSLSQGQFAPKNLTGGVDGSSTTSFVFTVVYKDTDGQTGQAPSFVRVVIDGTPFDMTSTGGTNPIYANGVTYTYSTSLAGGSHLYHFEASDGTGFAVFDNEGSKSSGAPITGIVPIQGPIVNDNPVLSGGAVTPNTLTGLAPGTSVTYTVTYSDRDGDAPSQGYPRVWVDNPTEVDYSGTIASVSGSVLTIQGVNWTPAALAGKLLQITTGLVPGGGAGSTASGRIYTVVDNSANSVIISANDAGAEGILPGDTVSIGYLVMTKQNPLQTDYRTAVVYQSIVTSMPIGNHQFHFSVSSPPTYVLVRHPDVGELSGPLVNNTPPVGNRAPVLTGGVVDATQGLSTTTFNFQVNYSDADNDAAAAHNGVFGYVKVVFTEPGIPAKVMSPVTVPVTSWILPVQHRASITGLPAGTHRFHFEASDGYRAGNLVTRFPANAASDQAITIFSKPVLSFGAGQGVSPATGTPTTNFIWRITYSNADNRPGTVKVIIDGGTPINMVATGSNYVSGVTYTHQQMLGLGNHTYRFTANDGLQDADPTTTQSGPLVQNLVGPELSAENVTPSSGPASSPFTYQVKYRDTSGQPPSSISVYIDTDPTGRVMIRDMSYGTGGVDVDGWMLFKSSPITLSGGSHTYFFVASNGQVSTRFPAGTGTFSGPVVSGAGLTISASPSPADLGDQIIVSGVLSPSALNPATISLQATRPDSTIVTKSITTSSTGAYSSSFTTADVSGAWIITATWAGGSGFLSQTQTTGLTVGGMRFDVVAGKVDMVGLTLIPISTDPSIIFGDVAAATRLGLAVYSPPTAQYLLYPRDAASFVLNGGSGFWIRPTTTESIIANGRLWPQDTAYTVPLVTGWNQIASVFVNPISLANVQVRYQGQTLSLTQAAARLWIKDYAWGYDAAIKDYFLVREGTSNSTLLKGRGYWVKALVDCELILRP